MCDENKNSIHATNLTTPPGSDQENGSPDPSLNTETPCSPATSHFMVRLRQWLNPAGTAGGAYLLAGGTCPCCGGTCPVGVGGAVAVGGVSALVARLWHKVRPGGDKTKAPDLHASYRCVVSLE
jgi:hypothetical protein